jgi:hypothetical protein
MFDTDTFLTQLYVTVDDFCKDCCKQQSLHNLIPFGSRGPAPTLSPSETITLALFGQFARFTSERAFWRFAQSHLIHLFPTLPDRSQFNRLLRQYSLAIQSFALFLPRNGGCFDVPFECLDRVGVATRWCGRRGVGHLSHHTDVGKCSRLGFFHGVSLLTCVTPSGQITGIGMGPASAKDQPLAEVFFAARAATDHRLPGVGTPTGTNEYLVDKGFSGPKLHERWYADYGVRVRCPPRRGGWDGKPWSRSLYHLMAGARQIVETVHDKLLNAFRLGRERPQEWSGLWARVWAKAGLHNFCFRLNQLYGRPPLAFADLLEA